MNLRFAGTSPVHESSQPSVYCGSVWGTIFENQKKKNRGRGPRAREEVSDTAHPKELLSVLCTGIKQQKANRSGSHARTNY